MGLFADAIAARPPGLIPFVAGGDPGGGGLEGLAGVLRGLADAGAAAVEVGVPFSDPIADGPTIQAAYQRALDAGTTVKGLLGAVRPVVGDLGIPSLAMVSQSIVQRHGSRAFCRSLAEAGIGGLLVPDLPAGPASVEVAAAAKDAGLETILLVAPTTPEARRREIVSLATGFVYYLSVAGITGARTDLPPDLADNVTRLKAMTDRPVCVGFGIGRREQVRAVAEVADGVIVGSALVKHLQAAGTNHAAAAQDFATGLLND